MSETPQIRMMATDEREGDTEKCGRTRKIETHCKKSFSIYLTENKKFEIELRKM